jgi:hypothetical protein
MLIQAKCLTPAWDSERAKLYSAGEVYEIDRDSRLAELKVGSRPVFEFDRNANPDDKPHDYSCKQEGCGAKFKTLAELGSHTRATHKDSDLIPDPKAENIFADRTCECGRVCASAYGLKLHKQKAHPVPAAETVAA